MGAVVADRKEVVGGDDKEDKVGTAITAEHKVAAVASEASEVP